MMVRRKLKKIWGRDCFSQKWVHVSSRCVGCIAFRAAPRKRKSDYFAMSAHMRKLWRKAVD